jgi:23S rRNA (uracil1939-C5)-methyltransferase
MAGILRLKPRRIVYVSCDLATLARDVKGLVAEGYSLEHIEAFDLFPNTAHVETLVILECLDAETQRRGASLRRVFI